ncbi:MAG: nucleoside-diphosphate sugar epimerase/dehydratase [Paracoccaceae bacterium]
MYASFVAPLRRVMALIVACAAVMGIALIGIFVLQSATLSGAGGPSIYLGFTVLLFAVAVGSYWTGLCHVFRESPSDDSQVAIHGAGDAGLQLFAALTTSKNYNPVFIADDSPAKQRLVIGGVRVKPYEALERALALGNIGRVFLAMPSISQEKRKHLHEGLLRLNVNVSDISSYADILTARNLVRGLGNISADDLLRRDKVDLDLPMITQTYQGQSVLVTGAGGSVGSELARQMVKAKARRLVLYEHSESALYEIDRELRPEANANGVKLVAVLASVTDGACASAVLRAEETDIVLHAAAYKHVPIMENNEVSGAHNNVIGTQVMADASIATGVRRFMLISTDKAVRPTNVMGATKRLAELIIQDRQARSKFTLFSMVRFGNVLGSSGSVIPLFREQIKAGGPITLTHPDVARYFMTIPEAARLVLLAGAYAVGGEVFILMMGQPVRILDIAKRMVELSGLSVRDANNPNGDIEINYIGLRPGEKLFEEMFIGARAMKTPHPKIMSAIETASSQLEVARMLHDLSAAIEANNAAAVRRVIRNSVMGYNCEPRCLKLTAVS